MNYILYWVRKFRDLPMNFIGIAHSESKETPQKGERIWPLFNKALVEPMCGIFDVVGYMFTATEDPDDPDSPLVRKLLTEPLTIGQTEFYAKDRSPLGSLGRVMKDPTMPKIISRIMRDKNKPTNTTPAAAG